MDVYSKRKKKKKKSIKGFLGTSTNQIINSSNNSDNQLYPMKKIEKFL